VIRVGAIAVGGVLLAACTFRGIPGVESGAPTDTAAGDDADEVAPAADGADAEARGGGGPSRLPDGIAGQVCDAEGTDWMIREYSYDGPCWDPPGYRIAALMPTAAIRGRRAVDPTSTDLDATIWWFDIPEADLLGSTNCPRLRGATEEFWHAYEPYEDGGFTPFVVEDFKGMKLTDVLDKLDALHRPVCLTVRSDPGCDSGHGKVCTQSTRAGDPIQATGGLQLIVGTDILDEGMPDEQRRFPEVVNRPLDEVLHDLKARGFTNVRVIEDSVSCERGIVCESEPGLGAEWVGTGEEIRLIVRRAKKT